MSGLKGRYITPAGPDRLLNGVPLLLLNAAFIG